MAEELYPADRAPVAGLTSELQAAIFEAAAELGIDPVDLALAIQKETFDSFDPVIWGGGGDAYYGFIQFGQPERTKYGVTPDMSVGDQMQAVTRYLRGRGVEPGMGLIDIYSTILAGSPGLYDRADDNGTVRDHVAEMEERRARMERALLSPDEVIARGYLERVNDLVGAVYGGLFPDAAELIEQSETGPRDYARILSVQQSLIRDGYADGPATGVWSGEWQTAVNARDEARTSELQQYLLDGGYLQPRADGSSPVDGDFGSRTQAALDAARADAADTVLSPRFSNEPAQPRTATVAPPLPYLYEQGMNIQTPPMRLTGQTVGDLLFQSATTTLPQGSTSLLFDASPIASTAPSWLQFGERHDFSGRPRGFDPEVLARQQFLQQHGYFDGPLDGIDGPRTAAAEREHRNAPPLPMPRPSFIGPVTPEYPAPWTQRPAPPANTPSTGFAPPSFGVSPLMQYAASGGAANPWAAAFTPPALGAGTGLASLHPPGYVQPIGLLDVEAMQENERNGFGYTNPATTQPPVRTAGLDKANAAMAKEAERDEEEDFDVDAYIRDRNLATRGSGRREDLEQLAAKEITDETSMNEWTKIRAAQKALGVEPVYAESSSTKTPTKPTSTASSKTKSKK